MEIRIRDTGEVVTERKFRSLHPNVSMPRPLTEQVVNKLDADVVHAGEPAADLEWWQYSMRDGVEQIDGVWYTKFVAGPVFDTQAEEDAYIAQKQQEKYDATKLALTDAVQKRLDDFAATRNYMGILSLCTYATSAVTKFATEGQYGVDVRDATWTKCYEILAEVDADTRPIPDGYADIESELPVLEWPT